LSWTLDAGRGGSRAPTHPARANLNDPSGGGRGFDVVGARRGPSSVWPMHMVAKPDQLKPEIYTLNEGTAIRFLFKTGGGVRPGSTQRGRGGARGAQKFFASKRDPISPPLPRGGVALTLKRSLTEIRKELMERIGIGRKIAIIKITPKHTPVVSGAATLFNGEFLVGFWSDFFFQHNFKTENFSICLFFKPTRCCVAGEASRRNKAKWTFGRMGAVALMTHRTRAVLNDHLGGGRCPTPAADQKKGRAG